MIIFYNTFDSTSAPRTGLISDIASFELTYNEEGSPFISYTTTMNVRSVLELKEFYQLFPLETIAQEKSTFPIINLPQQSDVVDEETPAPVEIEEITE